MRPIAWVAPGAVNTIGVASGSSAMSGTTPGPRIARSSSGSVPITWRYARLLRYFSLLGRRGELLQAVVEQAVVVGHEGGPNCARSIASPVPSGRDVDHMEDALWSRPSRCRRRRICCPATARSSRSRSAAARVLDRLGIDEQTLLAREPRAHVELGNVFLREPFQIVVVAIVDLDARYARRDRVAELGDSAQQRVPARNAVERRAREIRLRLDPRGGVGILRVLEITVGIGHRDAEVGVGDRAHRRQRWRRLRVPEGWPAAAATNAIAPRWGDAEATKGGGRGHGALDNERARLSHRGRRGARANLLHLRPASPYHSAMNAELFSATILLILVIDPFGNVPVVVAALQERRAGAPRACRAARVRGGLRDPRRVHAGRPHVPAMAAPVRGVADDRRRHHPVPDCDPHGVSAPRGHLRRSAGRGAFHRAARDSVDRRSVGARDGDADGLARPGARSAAGSSR